MFTPQRKAWQTPRSEAARSTTIPRNLSKGKAVAFLDGSPPPPVGSLAENGERALVGFERGDGGMEDWRRFKEAGMLDVEAMMKKNKEALEEQVEKLENELHNYQNHMGLLLIEKNEWTAKHEKLSQALAEMQVVLKMEKSANHLALLEAERRVENLKNALGSERQCVAELEKALREFEQKHAQAKHDAESKFANANALVTGIEERSMEVEMKVNAAEAKLAEVNRRNAELERRSQEMEATENVIQRERLTLNAEREAHEATFIKKKEDLLEWERKLQAGEQKLCDGRRALKDKEENVDKVDRISKQKEKEFEDAKRKIDSSHSELKAKEENFLIRHNELIMKEEKAESLKMDIENKEKVLQEWEDKLNAREKGGIQSLLDEQKAKLDKELHDFELQRQQMITELEKGYINKSDAIDKKEVEIQHMEAKLAKREQTLEKKSERVKAKEKEMDGKIRSLKERGKNCTTEERKLAAEKEQLENDKNSMENLKVEIKNLKFDVSQKQLQIQQEKEMLEISKQERAEHDRLQLELKQEIEKCRQNVDSLLKEREELRHERERFEKEWEVLDEKRVQISQDLRKLEEEKQKFEMFCKSEEERLRTEKNAMQDHLQMEMESMRLEKESFSGSMKHEQSLFLQKAEKERREMRQDFESKAKDLESEMQRKKEDIEQQLGEKERAFQEMQDKEMNHINKLKQGVHWETEELKSERRRMEKEKQELTINKQQLELHQLEMRKDIDKLNVLSRKLKEQREQFIKERSRFLAFVEKLRNCTSCGDIIRDFVLSDLQVPVLEESMTLNPSSVADKYVKKSLGDVAPLVGLPHDVGSGGRLSWLQKCTSKLFTSPPGSKSDKHASESLECSLLAMHEKRIDFADDLPLESDEPLGPPTVNTSVKPLVVTLDDSFSARPVQMDYISRDEEGHQSEVSATAEKDGRRKAGRNGKAVIRRTRSVKAVVEDAKVFLGESVEGTDLSTSHLYDSANILEGSREDSGYLEKADRYISRKSGRARKSKAAESELNDGDSEGPSDSVSVGGRRKRRQVVTMAAETPVSRRYNLRRHKIAVMTEPVASVDVENNTIKEADVQRRAPVNVADHPDVAMGEVAPERVTTISGAVVQEITSSKTVRASRIVSDSGESADPPKVAERKEPAEGVRGALPEYYDEDQNGSVIHDELEYEGEEGEEEEQQPGSIGKKIWTFFTT